MHSKGTNMRKPTHGIRIYCKSSAIVSIPWTTLNPKPGLLACRRCRRRWRQLGWCRLRERRWDQTAAQESLLMGFLAGPISHLRWGSMNPSSRCLCICVYCMYLCMVPFQACSEQRKMYFIRARRDRINPQPSCSLMLCVQVPDNHIVLEQADLKCCHLTPNLS